MKTIELLGTEIIPRLEKREIEINGQVRAVAPEDDRVLGIVD
jgi:hypothetical protein